MQIIKSTNGFPYAWKAGRVEYLIRDILARKVEQQLSVNKVMFINPTWLHENDIDQNINDENPDFIICHNFADPVVPRIFDAIKKSGRPYIMIGNADHCRLDFWAMVCDLYFKSYSDQETFVLSNPEAVKKYICLNRKPHPHRIRMVEQLKMQGVFDDGYVSLGLPGAGAITVDSNFDESQGITDEHGNIGIDERFVSNKIRNDIFSVGDLEVWNRSYLCLVTETEFSNGNPQEFFISEKTWKPVLGYRPFFVYGQPKLREYLKAQGFDIFEDIFDYSIVDETLPDYGRQVQYAQVAINAINKITSPYGSYCENFYRFQQNKKRFHDYVYEQWSTLNNLNLNDYL
jgi:hypothetical protein